MITWSLIVISSTLAFAHSWWWLSVVILLSLFKLRNWYYHKSKPWRRIHFPAMLLYATAAGTESADAQTNNREFEIRNALINLVLLIQKQWSQQTAEVFVGKTMRKSEVYYDEDLIRATFKKRNNELTDGNLDEIMNTLNTSLIRTDNSWLEIRSRFV